jgi:hypothetical protein
MADKRLSTGALEAGRKYSRQADASAVIEAWQASGL